MDIGSNIAKARKYRAKSQEDLANDLNVSRQCVSLWENNQTTPTLDNMIAISNVLGYSVDVLLGQRPFPNECNNVVKQNEELENKIKFSKKYSVAGFVLGICSIMLFIIPFIGTITPLIGGILCIIARRIEKNNLNLIGLVFNIVYVIASLITVICLI